MSVLKVQCAMLTAYTDVETIRALLGVNELEVEDSVILLPAYNLIAQEALLDLNPATLTMYGITAAADPKTSLQRRYYESVRLFTAASVAKSLLPALSMFAPQNLEDEKDKFKRFDNAVEKLRAGLDATTANMSAKILSLLNLLAPGSGGSAIAPFFRSFAGSVGIGNDPVTGV